MFSAQKIGMIIAALFIVGALTGTASAAGTENPTPPAHARTTSVPHR